MPFVYLALGAVGAAVAAALAVASRKPDEMIVERTAELAAPPSAVYPHVAEFRKWAAWSPWERLDPGMDKSYSGAPTGVGQVYAWDGNKKVGAGLMTMEEVVPEESVRIRLEFLRPFKTVNETTLRLAPAGDGTRVVWTMRAPQPLLSKAMGLFVDLDAMIGADFERGLEALAQAVADDRQQA